MGHEELNNSPRSSATPFGAVTSSAKEHDNRVESCLVRTNMHQFTTLQLLVSMSENENKPTHTTQIRLRAKTPCQTRVITSRLQVVHFSLSPS